VDIRMNTSYLHRVFRPSDFQASVKSMLRKVSEVHEATPFEAIAFTGQSGAAIAYILSYTLQFPMILVRQDDDRSHRMMALNKNPTLRCLEGEVDAPTYLIVDDQIERGRTVNLIVNRIQSYNPSARCVGVVLYAWNYAKRSLTPEHPRMFNDDENTFPVYFGGSECMSKRL
jgi:adenine/guanine phosphoribosyltransferase-like PRPP-binding protein